MLKKILLQKIPGDKSKSAELPHQMIGKLADIFLDARHTRENFRELREKTGEKNPKFSLMSIFMERICIHVTYPLIQDAHLSTSLKSS